MMGPQQNRYAGDYPRNLENTDVTAIRNPNIGDRTPVIYSQVNKRVNPQPNRYAGERKPYDYPRNLEITDVRKMMSIKKCNRRYVYWR
jgi:hypothetical protein